MAPSGVGVAGLRQPARLRQVASELPDGWSARSFRLHGQRIDVDASLCRSGKEDAAVRRNRGSMLSESPNCPVPEIGTPDATPLMAQAVNQVTRR
jgi:hypothetical protein